jgi:hypothetical protein
MLRRIRDLCGCQLLAADGEVGHAEDFYFDDTWHLRYLVTHPRALPTERLLIRSEAIHQTDWSRRAVYLAYAPDEGVLGANREPRLRSARALLGQRIHACGDEVGHIEELLIEDETWELQLLVLGSQSWWWFGRKVVISPGWVEDVSWPEGKVLVRLPREEIEQAPEWIC